MMNRESILRGSLWVAAAFNLGGAALFAFPESSLSQMAGFPVDVPVVYRAFVAFFVLLFAGAYIWQAIHRPIVKPLVVFGAIGKAGAFSLAIILSLANLVSAPGLLVASGDLVLAVIFMLCVGARQAVQDGRVEDRAPKRTTQ
jgi:hypothetical protein